MARATTRNTRHQRILVREARARRYAIWPSACTIRSARVHSHDEATGLDLTGQTLTMRNPPGVSGKPVHSPAI
jgi:hypothetical protein